VGELALAMRMAVVGEEQSVVSGSFRVAAFLHSRLQLTGFPFR